MKKLAVEMEKCTSATQQLVMAIPTLSRFLRSEQLSDNTISAYVREWELFSDSDAIAQLDDIGDLSASQISAYLLRYSHAPHATKRALSAISKMLELMHPDIVELHLLPSIQSKMKAWRKTLRTKTKKRPMPVISSGQIESLAFEVRHSSKADTAFRNELCIHLLTSTLIRATELTSIQLRDVSIEEKTLSIRGKGAAMENDGSARRVSRAAPLSDDLLQRIMDYVALHRYASPGEPSSLNLAKLQIVNGTAPLLTNRSGRAFSYRCLYEMISNNVHEVRGVGRNNGPHLLRRSCATRLLDLGVDIRSIQEILGHADVRTTEGYLPPRDAAIDAGFKLAGKLLGERCPVD